LGSIGAGIGARYLSDTLLIHIGKYRAGIGAGYTRDTVRHPFGSIEDN